MEVDSSPGPEGLEKATDLDIASQIITFIDNARQAQQDQDSQKGLKVSQWLRRHQFHRK